MNHEGKVLTLKKKFAKGDTTVIIIVAIVLIFGAVFYLPKLLKIPGSTALITNDGVVIKTIDLTIIESYSYTIYDSNDVEKCCIEVNDGKIRFLSSTCPDQICVHAGWLEHEDEFAACLPNNVIITIK